MALRVLTRIGALLLIIGAPVQAEEVIYKAVGQDITLVPQYDGSPSEINWKVNGDKLVEMELSRPPAYFYRLEDRAKIDETNGRLTIANLNTGDSALYKAEVLVNSVIHETIIRLIVLGLPEKPIITNRTIDEKTIELTCNSATPNVKYEWWNKTSILSNQQSYNASRSTEDVTLTCVVYNEVSRINSTELVLRLPDPGPSGGIIALIVILVLALPSSLLIFFLRKRLHKYPWVVRNCLPCLTCCISNKTNGEPIRGCTPGEPANVPLIDNPRGGSGNDVEKGTAGGSGNDVEKGTAGGSGNDVEKGTAAKNEDKNVMQEQDNKTTIVIPEANKTNGEPIRGCTPGEPANVPLIGNPRGGSGNYVESGKAELEICGAILLKLFPSEEAQSMELWNDVMSLFVTLCSPGTIKSLCLTVEKVEDPEDYTATVSWANGETRVSTIKDSADIARITSEGGGVKLVVKNARNVKTIDLKEGVKTRYHLTVEGQRVQINDIILEPQSVTIKNLKPEDSGTYKVDIHSTDDSITSNTFTLKANHLLENSKRTIELAVKRAVTPENGLSDGKPIGNITFHPINITNVASITWKKDNQPVDTKGSRIKVSEQGDLVINNVTSADAGSYTVHSEGQTLEQEFILRL